MGQNGVTGAAGERPILILGATGMLGHKMWQILSARFPEVYGTMRSAPSDPRFDRYPFLKSERITGNVDALDIEAVLRVIRALKPGVVVNCIGSIKQRASADNPLVSIPINSLLPHQIAAEAAQWEGKTIHFSTDCVFSGQRGDYSESDPSDAEDLYGKSKHLGELLDGNALVLRSSIIGRELDHHASLLDWLLLGNHRTVRGFTRAWWSGVTTNHMANLVGEIIGRFGYLKGLYHVSSGKISKYDLLILVKEAFGLPVEIVPDDTFFCDRSLTGERLREAIGYTPTALPEMLAELARDATPYERLKRQQ